MLLTSKEFAERIRINVSTLSRWLSLGRVPPPMRLGGKACRWDSDEVEAWIKAGMPLAKDWAKVKAAAAVR